MRGVRMGQAFLCEGRSRLSSEQIEELRCAWNALPKGVRGKLRLRQRIRMWRVKRRVRRFQKVRSIDWDKPFYIN